MHDRLTRAGFPPEEVAGEIDRLEAVGLIDDARFAQEYCRAAASNRGLGRRALASALYAKGIDRDVIEAAVAQEAGDDEDEESRALELARSRVRRLRGNEPAKAFAKLSSALARRGYAPDLARRAARKALEIDAVEAASLEG